MEASLAALERPRGAASNTVMEFLRFLLFFVFVPFHFLGTLEADEYGCCFLLAVPCIINSVSFCSGKIIGLIASCDF